MEPKNISFKDKTVVFTGDLCITRDEAKSRVILLGGRCTIQPSSKTDYLVVGRDPGPSKLKKAKDLKIKIIEEDTFLTMTKEIVLNISPNVESGMCVAIDDQQLAYEISSKNEGYSLGAKSDVFHDLWTEKYRPKLRKHLIGNQSILKSLEDFLKGKTGLKAALLSGPPGIGKTTLAHMVATELKYTVIEFNASDVRNKTSIINNIKGLVNSYGISTDLKINKKVIIMDEVDGMSSDRGGIVELTNIIKSTNIPIICICNDRNNLKIRTLSKYCLDLKFRKLDSRSILPRLKEILKMENKIIDDKVLNEIILLSNGDMRYILNSLQNLAIKSAYKNKLNANKDLIDEDNKDSYNKKEDVFNVVKKIVAKNIFDLSTEIFRKNDINSKLNIYFEDYSMLPLFVQENYLHLNFDSIKKLYNSSESISQSDVVEKLMRGSTQEWSLTPLHGFLSSILPTRNKHLHRRIDYPLWLGQNSKYRKNLKNLQALAKHTSRHIHSALEEFRKYEINLFYKDIINNLKDNSTDKVIELVKKYDIIKEDIAVMSEIIINGGDQYKEIKTKTKTEFTRKYNKINRTLPYTLDTLISEDDN